MAGNHGGPRSRCHFNIWAKLVKEDRQKNMRVGSITSPRLLHIGSFHTSALQSVVNLK